MHQVLFPASLTPRQRALLHGVAEAEGLPHASEGTDANRRIAIGSGHLVRHGGREERDKGVQWQWRWRSVPSVVRGTGRYWALGQGSW